MIHLQYSGTGALILEHGDAMVVKVLLCSSSKQDSNDYGSIELVDDVTDVVKLLLNRYFINIAAGNDDGANLINTK